jgi:hypothetical protein
MIRVWKAELTDLDSDRDALRPVKVQARKGAKCLYVGVQGGIPCLWFEVDDQEEPETMTLYCIGTGWGGMTNSQRKAMMYIGTVVVGGYVWHLYR